jgi:hypothetical protein
MTSYKIVCRDCPPDGDLPECPYLVMVGWDDDLDTYWGRVQDLRITSAKASNLLVEVGTEPHQLPSVHALQEAIDNHALIPDDVWGYLERDGRRDAPEPPSFSPALAGLGEPAEDDDDFEPREPVAAVALSDRVDAILRDRRSSVVGAHGGVPGASALAEYRRQMRRHLSTAVPKVLMVVLGTFALAVIAFQFLPLLALAIAVGGAGLAWKAGRVPDRVSAWRRGARGERTTAKLLAPLERHGFTIFHDLNLPGGRVNIDHLVIGPTGTWTIDSKAWRNRTVVDKDGRLWRGRAPADHTVRIAWWEAEQVATLFSATGIDVGVNPVLVVHGTPLKALEAIADPGVRVIAPDYLAAVVSRPPATLWPNEAEAMVERVRVVFGLPARPRSSTDV